MGRYTLIGSVFVLLFGIAYSQSPIYGSIPEADYVIDALSAFQNLLTDMRAANPTLPKNLPIVSALRNMTYQAGIWNRKWNGTSRHHWGTDLDFYSLSNGDFDHGVGKIIYDWMSANAHRYGFCQPYTAGRCAGYNEERWHWSFQPVSEPLRQAWNRVYGDTTVCKWASRVQFDGAKSVGILAPAYVNTINPGCFSNP